MDSVSSAVLLSWNIDGRISALLLAIAAVYICGWVGMRRLRIDDRDHGRLACFLFGVAAIFLALESPLEVFDTLYLSAHMTQHLLLMMIAPPLILLSHPTVPLLRGLPKSFVKEGIGPFLTWPLLRRGFAALTFPPVSWGLFAASTVLWHVPFFYQLALSTPAWHGLQHAFFFWTGILYWWPIIHPVPGRSPWPRWIAIPYLLFADIVNTVVAAFFVFSGVVLYPSYANVRTSGVTALSDQTLAGLIMWVPGSVIYLVPAIVFTMQVLSPPRPHSRNSIVIRRKTKPRTLSLRRLQTPALRRAAQTVMLLIAAAVMADGFWGTQVTPMNLAGVLPWIHWRALSVIALLLVGNLFCMVCPFTLLRDLGRRVLPAKFRWPRQLRNKWIPVFLLLVYLWAYEAFGLWDSPWLTAAIVAGYFVAALVVDGLFRGASFCKYVCPIGQFHFISSMLSPREIGVRSLATCQSCRTHDCIRGNDHTRGCELNLFQPKKAGNLDCTFCLDCVKACPVENVTLVSIAPASSLTVDPYRSSVGRLSKRTDWAVLACIVVFGAFVNAAGMTGPVMMWEHGWHAILGPHMMPVAVGGFTLAGTLLIPAVLVLACYWLNELGANSTRRFVFALIPVGFAMWLAHLLYHFATTWTAPFVPAWFSSVQILFLDAGLLLTLYVAWRIALQIKGTTGKALTILAPWASVAVALWICGVWILFQPMQMRGVMH